MTKTEAAIRLADVALACDEAAKNLSCPVHKLRILNDEYQDCLRIYRNAPPTKSVEVEIRHWDEDGRYLEDYGASGVDWSDALSEILHGNYDDTATLRITVLDG